MEKQEVYVPEVAPNPELLEEIVSVPIVIEKAKPTSPEEKIQFLRDLHGFSDWWKLPLPKWCYDLSPMDNPIAVQFFLHDVEHYTKIKKGEESMPEDEFKKFEEFYLKRLEEYRELRRQKSPLTLPYQFSQLPCFESP